MWHPNGEAAEDVIVAPLRVPPGVVDQTPRLPHPDLGAPHLQPRRALRGSTTRGRPRRLAAADQVRPET